MPPHVYELCCCLVGRHSTLFGYVRTDWPRFWRKRTLWRCARCGSDAAPT